MAIATPPQSYPFSVYTFTGREISQIATLMAAWTSGRILPIDQRRYSKQVLQYAEGWRLLDRRADGRLVPGEGRFHVCCDLPVEALWRLVEPMLGDQRSCGRGIARDPGWLILNIWPEGDKRASETSLQEQIDVLDHLARHNYVRVQMAGSIWRIERRHD